MWRIKYFQCFKTKKTYCKCKFYARLKMLMCMIAHLHKFIGKSCFSWLTLFHFPCKIRAIYSEKFRSMFRSISEETTKILIYVGRCKLPGERGEGPHLSFFEKIETKCSAFSGYALIMAIYGLTFYLKCNFKST